MAEIITTNDAEGPVIETLKSNGFEVEYDESEDLYRVGISESQM